MGKRIGFVVLVMCLQLLSFGQRLQSTVDSVETENAQIILLDSLMQNPLIKNHHCKVQHFGEPHSIINAQRIQTLFEKTNFSFDIPYHQRIDYYVQAFLKNSERRKALGIISALLEEYDSVLTTSLSSKNLPEDFKYFAAAKSALMTRYVSTTGASGIWQFTYTTARYYGLHIDSYVDDRRDIHQSSIAAANMFSRLHEIYEDHLLVLAAWSCGPGNINKAVRRSGEKTKFWELYPYLPVDLREDIPAFMAMALILKNPAEFGISKCELQFPQTESSIVVKEKIHLGQVKDAFGIPMHTLQYLNPIYKHNVIPKTAENYKIHLPDTFGTSFQQWGDSIYAYHDSVYFAPKPNKKALSSTRSSRPRAPKNGEAVYYKVRSGDNLGYIAQHYHVRVSDIRYWNGLRSDRINIGQTLVLYPKGKPKTTTTKSSTSSKPKTTTSSNSSSGSWTWYTVKSGDSPHSIAKKYPGVSEDDIMKWNKISNPRSLRVGQKLKIKK